MKKINLESTKNCKIINTLQAKFKSEDGNEIGRGYPDEIVDEILKISQIENFKDLNVAVVEDYNLEMASRLVKLGAKVSLIYCSKRLEKFAKNIYKEDVFEHILYYEDIGNLNMKFDLIIATPPSGKNCSLAIKIINNLLGLSKLVTFTLINIIKNENIVNYILDYMQIANALLITSFDTKPTKKFDEYHIRFFDKPFYRTLYEKITTYNQSHENHFTTIDGNFLSPKWEKTLDRATKLPISSFSLIGNENKTIRMFIDEKKAFVTTSRTPGDGVHFNDSYDQQYNLENKYNLEWNMEGRAIDLHIFGTTKERDNFCSWWYSCNSKRSSKKERIGLTNACLDILNINSISGANSYRKCLPHVDWSRSWTDEEILEEIGLPKDFLKDYNNK